LPGLEDKLHTICSAFRNCPDDFNISVLALAEFVGTN
jgi:hypothetical protein